MTERLKIYEDEEIKMYRRNGDQFEVWNKDGKTHVEKVKKIISDSIREE